MKVLTTAGLTKLIQLCKNAIPTVPVTDVTVGGTSVVSSGVAAIPAIPTVNDATITITQGGVTKGSFTLNQASGDTIALDAGGGDVEWAIYGTTTHQQISDWANAGKEVLVKSTGGVTVYRLVHVDVSEHIFTTANLKAISYCYVTSQNAWYSSSNNLQTQIPAGTAGNVITYTGTAGSIGSATLATVATTGSYSDLSGTPTIPTVNNPTITITQGGVTKGSFTLNQSSGDTIALDAGVSLDNTTITRNAYDNIQTIATINPNPASGRTNPIYDWVGTLAEYTAQDIETNHPDYVCFITDDFTAPTFDAYSKVQSDARYVQKAHEVIEFQAPTAQNNYTWYRKYADGWVEQGGKFDGLVNGSTSWLNKTVSLPIQMADTNYSVIASDCGIGQNATHGTYNLPASTTQWSYYYYNASDSRVVYWQVSGMYAQ